MLSIVIAVAVVLATATAAVSVFAADAWRANAVAAVGSASVQTTDGSLSENKDNAYYADNFATLPSDFEQVRGSDTANTRTAFFDGEMFIYHDNTAGSASNYYGAAYEIAKGRDWDDFEFEMTFRAVHWVNTGRFLAVMFHTRRQDDRLVGYMVNYRVNGNTAVSALNKTPAANDIRVLDSHKPSLDDKGLHTLKIRLVGTACEYYIDDALCSAWQTDRKSVV